MSNNIHINLLNSDIIISVGEPWDFTSAVGDNRLEGVITNIIEDILFCDVTHFIYQKKNISKIIALNRNVSTQDILRILSTGERVYVNMFFSTSENLLTELNYMERLEKKENVHFLIGSIRLKK